MTDWIKKRENQIFFSVTLITIFVAISPLLSRYCLLGHDSEYHLLRIEALKDQIMMWRPFLRVNPLYFGGMGYASSMFYPDILLYIPAFMRVLGFGVDTSYHSYMAICIILGYLVTYICGKKITDNRYISMFFAVILTLSSYHLDDIMVRAAAGEYTAFVFIPIVVYGLFNLFFEEFNKPYVLGLGMGLVLLSHTLSFVMCLMMIVILMMFNFDVFLKAPKLILKLAATALVTLAATAFYWIPVLEQFSEAVFYVSEPWIEPVESAVKLVDTFTFSLPTLGVGLMILLLPRVLIFRNHDDKVMKFADQCIVAGFMFAIMATDIVPWKIVGKYFSMIQFPWRFYVVSSVLLAFGAATVVYRLAGSIYIGVTDCPDEYDDEEQVVSNDKLVNKYGLVIGLVLTVMTVAAVYGYSIQDREYYDHSNDYFNYKPFTTTVIAGEWLPKAVDDKDTLIDLCEKATDNNGSDVAFVRNRGKLVVSTNGSEGYIDIPLIYYKGYTAKGESGADYAIDGSGTNGTARVYTNDNADTITVNYTGTVLQRISELISLITVIVIVCFFIKKIK